MKKQQVLVIHGGGNFVGIPRSELIDRLKAKEITLDHIRRKEDWKFNLADDLGEEFEVFAPRMPNADQPLYREWEVWFEKILTLLDRELVVVGHSLGGLFLLKYFSSPRSALSIRGLFSVAAPYITETGDEQFRETAFALPEGIPLISASIPTYLYHSADDPIVPFKDLETLAAHIPHATARSFTDRGHFNVEQFPELVADIRQGN